MYEQMCEHRCFNYGTRGMNKLLRGGTNIFGTEVGREIYTRGIVFISVQLVTGPSLPTAGSREPHFYWDNNLDYELSRCGTMQMGTMDAIYLYTVRVNPFIFGTRQHEGKAIGIYSRCASGACFDTGMDSLGSRYHSNFNFLIGRNDDIDEIKTGLCMISSAFWSRQNAKNRGITYKQANELDMIGSQIGSR